MNNIPIYPSYLQYFPEYTNLFNTFWCKTKAYKENKFQKAYKVPVAEVLPYLEEDLKSYLVEVFLFPKSLPREIIRDLPSDLEERRESLLFTLAFFMVLEENGLQDIFTHWPSHKESAHE